MAVQLPLLAHPGTAPNNLVAFVRGNSLKSGNPQFWATAMALACAYPFDPQDTEYHEARGYPSTLLGRILGQVEVLSGSPQGRRLPDHLGDTLANLGTQGACDGEWLAGWVVAAGADPWVFEGERSLVDVALAKGCVAWVEAVLRRPDAPAVDTLLARPALNAHTLHAYTREWWPALMCHPTWGARMLRAVADAGATPNCQPELLHEATPEVVALYHERGWMPTDPATCRKIHAAWQARVKNHTLYPEMFSQMLRQLGVSEDESDASRHGAVVGHLLKGQTLVTTIMSAEDLLRPCHMPRIQLSGVWNAWSAGVYGRLLSHYGQLRFSQLNLAPLGAQDIWPAALREAPLADVRAALDTEWRPGIHHRAMVALGWAAVHPHERFDTPWSTAACLPVAPEPAAMQAWMTQALTEAVAWTQTQISARTGDEVKGLWWKIWDKVLLENDNAYTRKLRTPESPVVWEWVHGVVRTLVRSGFSGITSTVIPMLNAITSAATPTDTRSRSIQAWVAVAATLHTRDVDPATHPMHTVMSEHPAWQGQSPELPLADWEILRPLMPAACWSVIETLILLQSLPVSTTLARKPRL